MREISKGGGGGGYVARGFKFFLDDSIRFDSRCREMRASALNRVRCWEGGGRVDSLQVGEVRLVYILERREIQKFWRVFRLYCKDNYSRISSISRYSFPVARKQIS